jgi:hypothetical protein
MLLWVRGYLRGKAEHKPGGVAGPSDTDELGAIIICKRSELEGVFVASKGSVNGVG